MAKALRQSGLASLTAFILSCDARADRPPPLDAEMVQRGQQIYVKDCAACHGLNGEGAPGWRQPDERGELPAPPHDAEGHTWRHGDGMLYGIVRNGWRDPFNRTTRLTMPPFGDKLSPAEIRAVITYLKTWWLREQRRFQWEESQADPFPPLR